MKEDESLIGKAKQIRELTVTSWKLITEMKKGSPGAQFAYQIFLEGLDPQQLSLMLQYGNDVMIRFEKAVKDTTNIDDLSPTDQRFFLQLLQDMDIDIDFDLE